MEKPKEIETCCPASREEWRKWLEENHTSSNSVWLIYHKKNSGIPSLPWSDAVDEALCFGWIDSVRKPLDDKRFRQLFSRRKPKSIWSRVNKEKVERLIQEGLMMAAGYKSIEIARQNGSWSLMDEVEDLLVPPDLMSAFQLYPGSAAFYETRSKSVKKQILARLVLAKRPETRQKRVTEIAELAAQEKLPPGVF